MWGGVPLPLAPPHTPDLSERRKGVQFQPNPNSYPAHWPIATPEGQWPG